MVIQIHINFCLVWISHNDYDSIHSSYIDDYCQQKAKQDLIEFSYSWKFTIHLAKSPDSSKETTNDVTRLSVFVFFISSRL